jgi:pimeloyl-ACP methyl ester carboxylesterase
VRYDRELFDQQLVDLLTALGIDGPVHLAGVSVGGPIAVTFAARRPARVRSVTLVDPRSPAAQRLPWHVRAPIVGECHMALVRAPFLADSQAGDFFEPERFPDWARRFREFMRYEGFQRALLSTMRHYLQRDLSDDYRLVGGSALPLLVVWGEHDAGARQVVGELRRLMPRAEFRAIERAGHLPQYERPESVGPILVAFLRQERPC